MIIARSVDPGPVLGVGIGRIEEVAEAVLGERVVFEDRFPVLVEVVEGIALGRDPQSR